MAACSRPVSLVHDFSYFGMVCLLPAALSSPLLAISTAERGKGKIHMDTGDAEEEQTDSRESMLALVEDENSMTRACGTTQWLNVENDIFPSCGYILDRCQMS